MVGLKVALLAEAALVEVQNYLATCTLHITTKMSAFCRPKLIDDADLQHLGSLAVESFFLQVQIYILLEHLRYLNWSC